MIEAKQAVDEAQARKAAELLNLLESLIEDVQNGRLYGEFSVSFNAQAGKIGHYEESRKRTFK